MVNGCIHNSLGVSMQGIIRSFLKSIDKFDFFSIQTLSFFNQVYPPKKHWTKMRNHPCQVLQTWINDQIIVSIFIAKHTTSRKFFPQKKNEKKVWIKKPELTMNKIVSQTKRNAFSKINTRSWYWFQCSFPSIARQGGQSDTQDKIVWPRSDDKHLKYDEKSIFTERWKWKC